MIGLKTLRAAPLAVALCLLPLAGARAQYIQSYFPAGIPGFGGDAGITVQSRSRSQYDAEDVHIDGFDVRTSLSEAIGYDSNIEGISGGPGSGLIDTAPFLQVSSNWDRNSVALSLSADDQRYFSLPVENNTNWTAGLGGTYTLGRSTFSAGLAYLSEHQLGSEFGALETENPVPYHVIDARASFDLPSGRFTFTPNVEFEKFTYGDAIIGGNAQSQGYRDEQTLQGGVTVRFDLGGDRSLLAVVKGVQTEYTDLTRFALNEGSSGAIALFGLDYQTTGVFRYRVLAGLETRSFVSAFYGSQTAPIAEASVIWTPTGLTTVTDTLAREIESPASADAGDFTYTTNTLVIDHELRRDILLQGRLVTQLAEYLHQNTQDSVTLGGRVTWLISKLFRVTGDYSFSRTSGQPTAFSAPLGGQPTQLSSNFSDSRFMLTLRVTP
jgi:hypothetical protein